MLWFYLFILSIGVGGFFALLVAIARTPGLATLFPEKYFYHGLVGHVDSALIVGLYAFLIFLWHKVFQREEKPYEAGLSFLGFFLIFISALTARGEALWNNYIPTIVHPLFFAGLILFLGGVFLTALRFLPIAVKSLYLGNAIESILGISVINSVLFPLSLIVSYLTVDKSLQGYGFYENLFWFPGHIHQFVNASLLIASWILLYKEKVFNLRFLNYLLVVFPITLFLAQLYVDPKSELGMDLTNMAYAIGIGVPTLSYGVMLFVNSLKRWDFSRSVLKLSIFIYFLGALMGYMGVGMDLRVPAHYHTVIASILVAIMGLTIIFLMEFGFIKEISKYVKFIPFFYGFGMLLFVSGLFWAGLFGTPRKMPGTDYITNAKVYLFMLLMGLGSILSVIGGAAFVLYVLKSMLGRRKYEEAGG
ncbi:heme-copper oxidase family protein [Aquifex sp.]